MSSTSSVSTMATAGDERVPYDGGGAVFLPETKKEPQNVSQEAGQYESSGLSEASTHQGGNVAASIGMSELEQILIQKPFTRSEIQHLIELLHSRITSESPSDIIVVEPPPPSSSPSSLLRFETSRLKKCKHAGTLEDLPDKLLSNIFIRLFAKQLAQMRSVSKSWNAFLSQPSFIKSHLHRSIHNSNHLLVFYRHVSSTHLEQPFTVHSCHRSSHDKLANFIKLPVDPHFKFGIVVRVIGSVNGLICYSHGGRWKSSTHVPSIRIWNPSLSAVLTLPPFSMPSDSYDSYGSLQIFFRFGYDPKTDDYKVVKLTGLFYGSIRWWLEVEIYSMRKGTWELITERVPSHIIDIEDGDFLCADGHDGHLHWLCHVGKNSRKKTIVAFDLGSETFCEIPLPDSSTLDYRRGNILGVLAGKLCVVSADHDCKSFEVWVMDEYGVAESWVKHHVFSQLISDTRPLGFTSHNEFLLEDSYGNFHLHHLAANKQTALEQFPRGIGNRNRIVEYVDSLVWVAPDKQA